MNILYILVPVLVGVMGMVLISLLRGLNAFRQGMDEHPQGAATGPTPLQLRQNQMMWSRVKYQAIAIAVIMVMMLFAGR